MLRLAVVIAAMIGPWVYGCSKERTVSCEPTERYSSASSIPPVRVPDDLSPPDESGSLRVPPASQGAGSRAAQPCLESPPDFFEQSESQ
jgi:uncharacterized lipoprotein